MLVITLTSLVLTTIVLGLAFTGSRAVFGAASSDTSQQLKDAAEN